MTNQTIFRVASLLALLAGACATEAGNGALIGGGGGAAVGAGIGALAGGGKGALLGAGIGGAVGAGGGALIGHYMDKQQAELKNELKHAQVVREGDKLVVHFSSGILFESSRSELKPEAQEDLAAFAQILKKYSDTELLVSGFTDTTGSASTNARLSGERADAVVTYLTQAGVPRGRLIAEGRGPANPIGDNATVDGRHKNRRVEVEIKASDQLKQQAAAAAEKSS